MSDNNKTISAQEAAKLVLLKAYDMLSKSESLKKYQTENSPKAGVKYGAIEKDVKIADPKTFNNYEVKSGKSIDSTEPRIEKQVSPSKNPKEEAEGNNKPDGMEPRYEFKNKVAKELAKEKAASHHKPKDVTGNPGLGKAESLEKGISQKGWQHNKDYTKGVHREVSHGKSYAGEINQKANSTFIPNEKESLDLRTKKIHQEQLKEIKGMPKPKLDKTENPDKDADAKLGEKVEKDVEEHFKENKSAEAKEGHKLMVKSDENMPPKEDKTFIPAALVGSAKLSKFMERKHAKRKAAQGMESQSPEAVGHEAPDAPAPGSTEAGQPDNTRPTTESKKGNDNTMEKKYEGFKAVEASAAKSGASNPAAVAAAAGREKYGKEAFQHAAAAGKKMGKK